MYQTLFLVINMIGKVYILWVANSMCVRAWAGTRLHTPVYMYVHVPWARSHGQDYKGEKNRVLPSFPLEPFSLFGRGWLDSPSRQRELHVQRPWGSTWGGGGDRSVTDSYLYPRGNEKLLKALQWERDTTISVFLIVGKTGVDLGRGVKEQRTWSIKQGGVDHSCELSSSGMPAGIL